MPRTKKDLRQAKALEALRRFALSLPEAWEDFPWGEHAFKVGKKLFALVNIEDHGLHVVVKLPESATMALSLPFASPTGYGLGKSGWVTSTFPPRSPVPLDLMRLWIEESYRTIAPKALKAAKKKAAPRRRAS
jgi:predicted DNA-binding protein (MmcQ/YjbR family)